MPIAVAAATYELWSFVTVHLTGVLQRHGLLSEAGAFNFDELDNQEVFWPFIAITLAIPVAIALAVVIILVMRKRSHRARKWVALIAAFIYLLAPIILRATADVKLLAPTFISTFPAFSFRFLAVLGTVLFFWAGGGMVLAWAGRRAVRQLSSLTPLIAKALPLLIITLLFCYYAQEIWQIARQNSWLRIGGLTGLIFSLAVGLITVSSRERVADVLDDPIELERAQSLLEGTPFTADEEMRAPKLSWPQRANLVLNVSLTQVIQVFWFMVLVVAFLLILSWVSVPDSLASTWLGGPRDPIHAFGFKLPIGQDDVKVALALSGFAGLTFAASATFEENYKKDFVAPLLKEIQRTKVAVQAHRVEVEEAGKMPTILANPVELFSSI